MEITLSHDDEAAFLDIAMHPGMRPFMTIAGALVRDLEEKVLRYDLGAGQVETLVALKSQAEGARKLFTSLSLHLEQVRLGSSPPQRGKRAKEESKKPR